MVVQFYQYFDSVQILHTTTTVDDYDTLAITYTPKSAVPTGDADSQTVLMLDVSGMYHLSDGGLQAIYSADDVDVLNGFQFSEVVSPFNGN